MASLREKLGKHTRPHHRADMSDLGSFEDPLVPLSSRVHHGLGEWTREKQYSLRQRIMRSLNRNKPLPAWRPVEFNAAIEHAQEQQPSLVRKSIKSLSSLRDRFSSDASDEDETQSRRPSVIRKSFSSVSSSVRGIRTSISSRLSQGEERRSATMRYRNFPEVAELAGSFPPGVGYDDLASPGGVSSGNNSIPRLPEFDEILANAKDEKTSADNQSPNTCFSMSIFNGLESPFTMNWQDNEMAEQDEPVARKPTPVIGRLPIRIKRRDSVMSKGTVQSKLAQKCRPGTTSDSGISGCSDEPKNSPGTKLETSKVPLEWLDNILETSSPMRDGLCQVSDSIPKRETEEEILERKSRRVYVFVPDDEDNGKPWPKISYPDLKSALVDICGRFGSYYAPFAAYTSLTRTIQLFSSDSPMPENGLLFPDSILFTLQDVLDNWDPLSSQSFCEGDDELDEPTITDITFSTSVEPRSDCDSLPGYSAICPYEPDRMDLNEAVHGEIVGPQSTIVVEDKLLKQLNCLLQNPDRRSSDGSQSDDDDYDMTLASRMGFLP